MGAIDPDRSGLESVRRLVKTRCETRRAWLAVLALGASAAAGPLLVGGGVRRLAASAAVATMVLMLRQAAKSA